MSSTRTDRSPETKCSNSTGKRLNQYAGKLDATAIENGYIPSDQEWMFETPNQNKSEDVFIYGSDSKQNIMLIKFKRRPINNGKCILYAYLMYKQGDDLCDFEAIDLVNDDDSMNYRLNGLSIQILSPFRKIRVTFRGVLRKRNTIKESESKNVFTRIRCFWYPLTKAFDFKNDNESSFLSQDLSSGDLNSENLFEDRYEQYGQLKGTIQFESDAVVKFNFWGLKSKTFYGPESACKTFKRLVAYSQEGVAFHFGVCTDHSSNCSYRYGHCSLAILLPLPIVDASVSLSDALILKNTKELNITLSNNRLIKFERGTQWVNLSSNTSIGNCAQSLNSLYSLTNCVINGHEGGCLLIEEHTSEYLDLVLNDLKLKANLSPQNPPFTGLVTPINGRCYGDVCGGKGASLSQLAFIANQIKPKNDISPFEVPNGVIVTTNAYELFLKQNQSIAELLNKLQAKVWTRNDQNLDNEYEMVATFIKQWKLSPEIAIEVKKCLESVLGDAVEEKRFAVRSSAVGEDSEEMSAAGQMSSFLGVKGLPNIFSAILQCWSSQFTKTAVEYKHGYGQLINTPMAVVIQEMVDCDVAGVMFSCNPVNGDPRRVIITANYGLCETVVSAKSEPDTITVLVDTENDKVLKIESTQIGSKKYVIKVSSASDKGVEGTQESEINAADAGKCCLDPEMSLKLARLATFLRRSFGNERDIEWGIKDNKIYMLQSRPVTNLETYTEWEIYHELDHGMRTERSVLCRCNVGENIPGSFSPMGMSMWFGAFIVTWTAQMKIYSEERAAEITCPYMSVSFSIMCNQLFFDLKGKTVFGHGKDIKCKASNISFFGHDMQDEDVERFVNRKITTDAPQEPEHVSPFWRIFGIFTTLSKYTSMITGPLKLKKSLDNAKTYKLITEDQNFDNPQQLFDYMFNSMTKMFEVAQLHGQCSGVSMNSNTEIILMLCNSNDNETELLHDVSLLLSSNKDVVSVDVPRSLREIATKIEDRKRFRELSDEEALKYLTKSGSEANEQFNSFLQQHGHRGYKEFDVMYQQWEQNPMPLVKLLKNIVGDNTSSTDKTELSASEILSKLKTNLSLSQRLMLRNFWLPLSQFGVGLREQSKSVLISFFNQYRRAFIKLSEMLVIEGRLPSPDLIFYLTLEELPRLLKERDATLVSKAKLRKKYFPAMNGLQFDEIIKGPNFSARNESKELIKQVPIGEKVPGCPVCVGQVTGRAIVAKSFEDVDLIQPNDILITFATDVGWSPYFPLLAGIATEIGGLVSHGAVIAREYGLPCIVGVKNATQIFSTGDKVTLDASNGFIYKV